MYAPNAKEMATLAVKTKVELERKTRSWGRLEIENVIDSFSGLDLQNKNTTYHVPQYTKNNTDKYGNPDGFPEVLPECQAGTGRYEIRMNAVVPDRVAQQPFLKSMAEIHHSTRLRSSVCASNEARFI